MPVTWLFIWQFIQTFNKKHQRSALLHTYDETTDDDGFPHKEPESV